MSSFASTSSDATDLMAILRAFSAGGLATVFSKCATAPVERVKLVLQLQNQSLMTGPSSSKTYTGMIDCFKSLCAEQGVASLWRGNLANVVKCFPSHALNLVLRDYYRLMFLRNVDRKKQYGRFILGNIASGGFGGMTTLCLTYPLDLARTRLAVDRNLGGIYRCLRSIVKTEGLAGTYRGFFISLQFVAISRAIFFGMFDTIRGSITDDPKQLHFITVFLLAQTCVISSGLICYPIDTVRRLLMLQAGQNNKIYNGSVDCFLKTLRYVLKCPKNTNFMRLEKEAYIKEPLQIQSN
jgi:solute carrier family 25 (adenine nucleotide translocator) protein 4/5/6/31